VPHWYKGTHTVAYWDKFSQPEQKPRFDRGILDTWWYDETKADRLAKSSAADSRLAANAKDDGPRDPLQGDESVQQAETPKEDGFPIGYLIGALVFAGLLALVVIRFRKRRLD
jgi:microcin C transport system substrate-binding protein